MQRNFSFHLVAKLAVCGLLFVGAAVHAADASGSWIWTTPGRNGGPDRTNTLTLKVEDTKVTGKLSTPGRSRVMKTEISDGKIDGDMISFNIVRERNGNYMTNKFSGKIEGDTITGKMEFMRNDEPVSRDWQAKRSTDASGGAGSADSK